MLYEQIIPLDDRVLVKPDPPETISKGGIILPQMGKERATTGAVIAIGANCQLKEYSIGSRVVYGKYAGGELSQDGQPLVILRENDLLAVILQEEIDTPPSV